MKQQEEENEKKENNKFMFTLTLYATVKTTKPIYKKRLKNGIILSNINKKSLNLEVMKDEVS
ncbi:hypothetical protein [Peptoniphilus indolicus]|uniref:Uncharacterized protein n=1 Tax=Peptoniphilus indolicus ATCC 29427 TaxID=997350 RepID=G4D6E9_9FIRM|nr:hypothetical protein [Peptoniphilus indolicus]EGY76590.1 hypothetical protein HMPREF9129_1979 [Peptoniphilus indolicus ATCC 29427]